MDNDIYRQIADYNDWVHLQHPAGGATEMKKLKGGKMKNEIKELLEFAVEGLRTCGEADKRLIWIERLIKHIPLLIAEIESLETEIKQLQAVREAAEAFDKTVRENCNSPIYGWLWGDRQKALVKLQQALAAKDNNA